jgi:hypothetical protein
MADAVTFRFSGADQFLVDLQRWRDRLQREVRQAAREEGEALVSLVQSRYAHRTGALRRGVKAKDESVGDTVLVRVRSLAPHSHLVERGTKMVRQTSRGWRRGIMPAQPIFVPEAVHRREAFQRRIRAILASPEPAIGPGSPTVTGSL